MLTFTSKIKSYQYNTELDLFHASTAEDCQSIFSEMSDFTPHTYERDSQCGHTFQFGRVQFCTVCNLLILLRFHLVISAFGNSETLARKE